MDSAPGLKIVGGETVSTNATTGTNPFPSYVNIFAKSEGSQWRWFVCGGTVVHAWKRTPPHRRAGAWVVTAAHCVDKRYEYAVNVWTGQGVAPGSPIAHQDSLLTSNAPGWRLMGPGGITIFRHPIYDRKTKTPDVALIRVMWPHHSDLPPPLLDAATGEVDWSLIPQIEGPPPRAGVEGTIVGFGKSILNYGAPSLTMQQAQVVIEPPGFQWEKTSLDLEFFRWVVGKSTTEGGALVAPRAGDSGGPLFVHPATSRPPRLAGVLCCIPNTEDGDMLRSSPAFYTSLPPFVGSARGAHAKALSSDGRWIRGISSLIGSASPVLVRSALPGGEEAPPWTTGNVWVEEARGEVPWLEFGALALGFVAFVGAIVGVARLCKSRRSRTSEAKIETEGEGTETTV